MKKIGILHENLQSMKPDDYYRDVIAQPQTNRKVKRKRNLINKFFKLFEGNLIFK